MKRLSIKSAAEQLSVSVSTVRRLVARGILSPRRNSRAGKGSRVYILSGELDAYSRGGEMGVREYRRRTGVS